MLSFREQVIAFARTAVEKAPQCHNEECTKQYLVLPFLRLLGYDPDNPNHVVAEHSADYSEKYRNRVDYLLKPEPGSALSSVRRPAHRSPVFCIAASPR